MCKKFQLINKVKLISHYLLIASLLATIACLLISYPYAEQFSMPIQVAAHILTIIFAGSFKVAVVALMAASAELKSINCNGNIDINIT